MRTALISARSVPMLPLPSHSFFEETITRAALQPHDNRDVAGQRRYNI